MTKIMAFLAAVFIGTMFLMPHAAGDLYAQDAKSLATDATNSKYAYTKESIKDVQRARKVLERRALHKIELKRRAEAKARAEARARREAARQAKAQAEAATPAPAPTNNYQPVDIPAALACIRAHESGGNYQAVNSAGYAGAYQLSPAYKDAWAARYGYSDYVGVPVIQWPPEVQDGVAYGLFKDTNGGAWLKFAPYSC